MSAEAIRKKFTGHILQNIDSASEDLAFILCTGGFGYDIELSDRDQAKLTKLHDRYVREFRELVRNANIKASDEAIAKHCSKIDVSGILKQFAQGGHAR